MKRRCKIFNGQWDHVEAKINIWFDTLDGKHDMHTILHSETKYGITIVFMYWENEVLENSNT